MKHLKLLLFFIPFALFACSDDDDIDSEIVGSWKTVGYTFEVETSDVAATKKIKEFYSLDEEDYFSIEFTKKGKAFVKDNEASAEVGYSIKGNKIHLTYEKETSAQEFVVNGNSLALTENMINEVKEDLSYIGISKDVEIKKADFIYFLTRVK